MMSAADLTDFPALKSPCLVERPLAIVDIETTGGNALYGRIIEIAVLRVERGKVVNVLHTLVNPDRFVPHEIEQITGITNEDVLHAPMFHSIARELFRMLDGALFVAHNARFDYGFIKNEFRRLGREFNARCLCTVKLSRKLFPRYRHHDLDSLLHRHELTCVNRHRAIGDATVVLNFLAALEQSTTPECLDTVVHTILKTANLPVHIDKDVIDALPETPGVYLFYGKGGELLYVGKSVCIRDRVMSHFSGDHRSSREMEIARQVTRIETRPTYGELGALLLELQLIKELRPVYNVASRSHRDLVLARRIRTPQGYARIELEKVHEIENDGEAPIMAIFKSIKQAKEYLAAAAKEYHLCHKLLGLERTNSSCFAYHLHQCKGACRGEEEPVVYNRRVEDAFASRRIHAWPFEGGIVIEERNPVTNEGQAFVIDNWCLLSSFTFNEFGQTELFRAVRRFDYDSYKIILRYVSNPRNRRNIRTVALNELYGAADNYQQMD